MYLPSAFKMDDLASLHEVMCRYPLATLVTKAGDGVTADHIPFLLDTASGDLGVLRAHVARANPLWRTHPEATEALAIFTGPDHYISPSWYATKRETGKVVPTWNYVAVHVHGRLRVRDDPVWLHRLLDDLTDRHEAGRPSPWTVADAPEDFITQIQQAIVGIEMLITRIEGKFKLSQNRSHADRLGVIDGLTASGGVAAGDMAKRIAQEI